MADEFKGKVYEILTLIAIKKYSALIGNEEDIFWNIPPKCINVECDFTIGKSSEIPRILYQVTHTVAGSASQKKFWRNIGEFVDARIAFGENLHIVSIMFDSIQKRDLADISDVVFDGVLEVDRQSYGQDIIDLALYFEAKYKDEKTPLLQKAVRIEQEIALGKGIDAVKQYAEDITRISRSNNTSSKLGWYNAYCQYNSRRVFSRIPQRRETYLRRGLGRLMPIDDEQTVKELLNTSRRKSAITELPSFLIDLQLYKETITGYVITEKIKRGNQVKPNELLRVVDYFDNDTLIEIWNKQKSVTDQFSMSCQEVASSAYKGYSDFVVRMYTSLCTVEGMKKALADCYTNPSIVLNVPIENIPSPVWKPWLFDYLMTIIKAHTGKQQGYGYSKLVIDAGLYVPGKRSVLDFVLPKYNNRTKMLEEVVLQGVASALATKLKGIGIDWISSNHELVSAYYLQGLFEDKIYKTDAFDPILELLKKQIPGLEIVSRHVTTLSELSSASSSTCYVAQVKDTIIMWQPGYDSHCNDKFKELMGRIGMLRTTYCNGKVLERTGIERYLLILDGTWNQRHINCLHRAGFDGIFYPDEIDILKEAIV